MARLLAKGHCVVAISRSRLEVGEHPGLVEINLPISAIGRQHIEGCEVLVHLAAHGVGAGMNDWAGCFQVNVHDSLRLWTEALAAGVRRLVVCGSCFEYGRSAERYEFIPVDAPLEPTGAYHSSKAAATMAALGLAVDKQAEVVIVRPFHVFGEGESAQRFWPSLRSAALAGHDFEMSIGTQVRDFVPVEAVASILCRFATESAVKPGAPKIHNIGSGVPCSLAEFASHWWKTWGAPGQLRLGAVPLRANEVMRYVPKVEAELL